MLGKIPYYLRSFFLMGLLPSLIAAQTPSDSPAPKTLKEIIEEGKRREELLKNNPALRKLAEQKSREEEFYLHKNDRSYWYLKTKKELSTKISAELAETHAQVQSPLTFKDPIELAPLICKPPQLYVVRKHADLPIYYFGFRDNDIQGLAWDRLWLFIEGKPGTILPDDDLIPELHRLMRTGSSGSDYRIEDIAKFFTVAEAKLIQLNLMEMKIKAELLRAKLIEKTDQGYVGKSNAALISTVAEGMLTDSKNFQDDVDHANAVHQSDIAHEFNHGIYFSDSHYREAGNKIWESLSKEDKEIAKNLMNVTSVYAFDEDKDLLIREFLAYFRDPEELLRSYLNPLASQILEAKEGDPKFRARAYYGDDGKLKPEIAKRIYELAEKVKSIDSSTKAYAMADSNRAHPLLDSVTQTSDKTKVCEGQPITPADEVADQIIRFRSLTRALNPIRAGIEDREKKNLSKEEQEALAKIRSLTANALDHGALENAPPEVQAWLKTNVKGLDLVKYPRALNNLIFMTTLFFPRINEIEDRKTFYDEWMKRKNLKPMLTKGLVLQILPDDKPISDIAELALLKGKTVDQLYPEYADDVKNRDDDHGVIDQMDGWGENRIFLGRVGNIATERIGVHEFSHFVHLTCFKPEDLDAIEKLYKAAKISGHFLDSYSAVNEYEYFAMGVQAYMNDYIPPSEHSLGHRYLSERELKRRGGEPARRLLLERDPDLYDFIEKLVGRTALESTKQLAVKLNDQK